MPAITPDPSTNTPYTTDAQTSPALPARSRCELIQACLDEVLIHQKAKETPKRTREALRQWMKDHGLGEHAGKSTLAQFTTFCVEILPHLAARGVPVDDRIAGLLIDLSGELDIRNIIYEANSAVVYARKNGGVTEALLDVIVKQMMLPNATCEQLRKTCTEHLQRPARHEFRGWAASYPVDVDGVGVIGIKVTIYLPDKASLDKVEARTQRWLDLLRADAVTAAGDTTGDRERA